MQELSLTIKISAEQYAELQRRTGKRMVTADDIKNELQDIIAKGLEGETAHVLGHLLSIRYYREDYRAPYGYQLYEHVFGGPEWPHNPNRPRLVSPAPGRLQTQGGKFSVDPNVGIIG